MPKRRRRKLVWSSPHPVEPQAGHWRMEDVPAPRAFDLPPPPDNDSEQTREELAELETLTQNRTEADVDEIRYWAVVEISPTTHWGELADEMVKRYRLSPPAAARIHCLMNEAIYASMVACWRVKYTYLRPRPTMLDPEIDVSVIPVPQHPSYPAGHSTVAAAAATVLAHFFPDDREAIWAKAEESGISRLKAGVHYRSDHEAGFRLGRAVGRVVVRRSLRDRGPGHYHEPE